MTVPNFNENIYPCEFCDYFRSRPLGQDHEYACNNQRLSIIQRDNNNDKPCRLLLIYCPLKEVKE